MARATRSSTTQLDKQKSSDPDPPPTQPSKKRKRQSVVPHDPDDQPASKQLRTDLRHPSEQQDDAITHPQDPSSPALTTVSKLPFAGDAPLDTESAQKILDILEITDSQGLLDRVFPLPSDPTNSQQQHSPQTQSYSLRALLQQSSQHPLWILRAATKQLLPISSHPRSQPSIPATSQRHFCDLALSLLDQASIHIASIPLDLQTILPVEPSEDASPSSPAAAPPSPTTVTKPRYALVQHLPNGDYWTSLNAENTSVSGTELKDLPTGHADLVGILPTTSAVLVPPKDAPTLGSFNTSKQNPVLSRKSLPEQRKLTTAHFLDYGSWASFAPAFDHEAQLVGRRELGEILWYKEVERREAEDSRRLRAEGSGIVEEAASLDVEMREQEEEEEEVMEVKPTLDEGSSKSSSIDAALGELLSPEEVTSVKAALKTLELQNAVQELMQRNSKALKRLEDLQHRRLSQEGGGSSTVEEGSEEWDTAQGILDSLAVLSSLRPRSSKEETSAIMPSAKVLHKLHQTLALEPRPGWYGSLPPARSMALRDDTTVKVRPGALTSTTTAASTAATASTPVTATPTPTSAATPYAGYSYYAPTQQATAAAQAYRPGATQYTPYKPGQYYHQSPYLTGQGTQQQSYYGQQGYAGAGATSQQPYAAYSSWYSSYAPMTATTTGTSTVAATGTSVAAVAGSTGSAGSGRGTPQPLAATSGATPYGAYYGGATATTAPPVPVTIAGTTAGTATATAPTGVAATPPAVATSQRTPVVANTVIMAAGKPGVGGTGVTGYASQAQMAAAAAASWGMNMGMGGMTYGQMVQGQQQLQQGQNQGQQTGAQQQQQVPTLPMHLRPQQMTAPAYYGAYQGQVAMQQPQQSTAPTQTAGR